jgi:AcrR family transcriptional regulator
MTGAQPSSRRGRQAEAARNDLLLLDAAREVFFCHGFDAPVSMVAQQAGVGIGSLYRRYATKEALLQHLCLVAMRQAIDAAAAGLTDTEPWLGLVEYIRRCVEFGAGALAPIAGNIDSTPEMWSTAREARELVEELVDRARHAGELRAGVTALDIALLIERFSRRIGLPSDEEENNRLRLLAIALDGLHATNAEPLPGRPPSAQHYESRWVRKDTN